MNNVELLDKFLSTLPIKKFDLSFEGDRKILADFMVYEGFTRQLPNDCKTVIDVEPSDSDLKNPEFNAIWNVIKHWDIQRKQGAGYAGATGTDVMSILTSLRLNQKEGSV
jgi:hypothetical protein